MVDYKQTKHVQCSLSFNGGLVRLFHCAEGGRDLHLYCTTTELFVALSCVHQCMNANSIYLKRTCVPIFAYEGENKLNFNEAYWRSKQQTKLPNR